MDPSQLKKQNGGNQQSNPSSSEPLTEALFNLSAAISNSQAAMYQKFDGKIEIANQQQDEKIDAKMVNFLM